MVSQQAGAAQRSAYMAEGRKVREAAGQAMKSRCSLPRHARRHADVTERHETQIGRMYSVQGDGVLSLEVTRRLNQSEPGHR